MTKKIEDGGPAFPIVTTETNEHGLVFPFVMPGMSMRDHFAGQAIPAIIRQCASDLNSRDGAETAEQYFALKAYEVADAMLAARKTGEA